MRRPALAAVLLVLGTLSACSDSAASDPGSASGYAGPTLPPGATEDTRAGALLNAQHYVATYNYARTTGDANGLQVLEADECRTCRALRHELTTTYDNGGRIEGGTWALKDPVLRKVTDGWEVATSVRVTATTVTSGTGKVSKERGATIRMALQISRSTGSWKVLACDKGF